jgi:cytochrome P450
VTAIPQRAVVRDFDHHDCPGITTDPFLAFDRYRDRPIFWTPAHGGYWVPTRFDDIRAILRDPVTFSSKCSAIPELGYPRPLIPVELDPPEHGEYRTLLTRSITGPISDSITKAIQRACARLVTHLAPQGACEIVADYAEPIQNVLFTTLFDIPDEHTDTWARWTADLPQHVESQRRRAALRAITDYLADQLARRRARTPPPDTIGLLDMLAHTELGGRPLGDEQMLDAAFLMVLGTVYTLSSTISFSFRHLAQHATEREHLTTHPDLVDTAANELLRLHSVANSVRIATRDTTIADTSIAEGDRLLLCLSLADRDPDTYPNPTALRFDRPPNPGHLAFGYGPHRCLGARIATHALTAALREWHQHIPAYTIRDDTTTIRTGGGSVCSLNALPLTWHDPAL